MTKVGGIYIDTTAYIASLWGMKIQRKKSMMYPLKAHRSAAIYSRTTSYSYIDIYSFTTTIENIYIAALGFIRRYAASCSWMDLILRCVSK